MIQTVGDLITALQEYDPDRDIVNIGMIRVNLPPDADLPAGSIRVTPPADADGAVHEALVMVDVTLQ